MKKYLDLLKRCNTLYTASRVYIAVMLDYKLSNKEKDLFQYVYTQYTQELKN